MSDRPTRHGAPPPSTHGPASVDPADRRVRHTPCATRTRGGRLDRHAHELGHAKAWRVCTGTLIARPRSPPGSCAIGMPDHVVAVLRRAGRRPGGDRARSRCCCGVAVLGAAAGPGPDADRRRLEARADVHGARLPRDPETFIRMPHRIDREPLERDAQSVLQALFGSPPAPNGSRSARDGRAAAGAFDRVRPPQAAADRNIAATCTAVRRKSNRHRAGGDRAGRDNSTGTPTRSAARRPDQRHDVPRSRREEPRAQRAHRPDTAQPPSCNADDHPARHTNSRSPHSAASNGVIPSVPRRASNRNHEPPERPPALRDRLSRPAEPPRAGPCCSSSEAVALAPPARQTEPPPSRVDATRHRLDLDPAFRLEIQNANAPGSATRPSPRRARHPRASPYNGKATVPGTPENSQSKRPHLDRRGAPREQAAPPGPSVPRSPVGAAPATGERVTARS